ncbi:hypothetical protein ONA23_05160 [Mycoplasmopsis cynos]|uniref:glycoside hydrolase family 2 TIM barrel-domain containing protein n=1 Tax=Mycoplasmopsis cynos TaxID=171284 RepID=UPI0024C69B19|nr:glycoside hydrolase family 2 TIM barrel-domain containing protein [Mycoplasmopsis cynos]WAM06350.1 hypothetical protein ONA23_05160 [Mycoplasmopsis cynos]
MHHDQGALGAVASYDAIYRQMKILKEMGVNAIRSTHNPSDQKLVHICEELGLLLIDELLILDIKVKSHKIIIDSLNKNQHIQKL